MNRQSLLHTVSRSRWPLVATALMAILLFTQAVSAFDISLRLIHAYAPSQFVDLNGDGEREAFSAEMTIYEDGTADGQVRINDAFVILPYAGEVLCKDGVALARARGTAYQVLDGDLFEIGFVTVEVREPNNPTGPIWDIVDNDVSENDPTGPLWDIVDNDVSENDPTGPLWDIVDNDVSYATGTLDFAADPCTAASSG